MIGTLHRKADTLTATAANPFQNHTIKGSTLFTLKPVVQIMNLHTKRQDARGRNCDGFSGTQSNPAEGNAIDESIHRKIEALIPRLRNYARVLTRDAVAADDLVQECFARALEKIHLWAEGTDLRAWLFTILYHQHISLARRDARQRAYIQSQRCHRSSTFSPPQTGRLELRDLQRALAQLPEEQRSLILLVGLEGMGYEEAASVANLPVGTVRSRVARGRETLRLMTGLFPPRHSRSARPLPEPAAPRLTRQDAGA